MMIRNIGLGLVLAAMATAPSAWAQPAAGTSAESTAAPAPADAARERQAQAQARQAETQADREREQKLKDAVQELVKEAREMGEVGKPKVEPKFSRPHPLLKDLDADHALPALNQMQQDWTGQKFMDTYVRWHLLWVVKQGRQSDRDEMGRRLLKLFEKLPGSLQVPHRPWHRYEPPDKAAEYHQKVNSLVVVEGYPPFQRRIGPPESLARMNPTRRAEAEKVWAEAQALRTQFEDIIDKEAVAFNRRIDQINEIVLNFQGELIYELLRTGDPAMLRVVMKEMERQIAAKSGLQFVLLNYVYLAAFDGILNLYPEHVLKEFSIELEKLARANAEYVDYRARKRNFGDYAFHMIYMLRDGGGFIDPRDLEVKEGRKRVHSQFR
jgi:hypothetical protein